MLQQIQKIDDFTKNNIFSNLIIIILFISFIKGQVINQLNHHSYKTLSENFCDVCVVNYVSMDLKL